MIKVADSSVALKDLAIAAKKAGLEVSEFTREMLATTSDKKVIEMTKVKDYSDVEHIGVMVFGKKDAVDALTNGFKLDS